MLITNHPNHRDKLSGQMDYENHRINQPHVSDQKAEKSVRIGEIIGRTYFVMIENYDSRTGDRYSAISSSP